jgi:hypothetical protein
VLGWGDSPGDSPTELCSALARFDPQGLAQALGRDEDHARWFADVCDALLPNYAYSLSMDRFNGAIPDSLPIIPLRSNVPAYTGPALPWPPGWAALWSGSRHHLMPMIDPIRY